MPSRPAQQPSQKGQQARTPGGMHTRNRNPMLRWQDPPSSDEDYSSERDSDEDQEGSTECIELLSDEDDDLEVIEILSSDLEDEEEDDDEDEEDIQVRRRAGSFSNVGSALSTSPQPCVIIVLQLNSKLKFLFVTCAAGHRCHHPSPNEDAACCAGPVRQPGQILPRGRRHPAPGVPDVHRRQPSTTVARGDKHVCR